MKTIWLCQDDEAEYDMLQLYREARSKVRDGYEYWRSSRRWRRSHDVLFALEDQAGDLP